MELGQKNSEFLAVLFDLDNTLIATRKADAMACKKLSEILWEKNGIPLEIASIICHHYLIAFRKCPENPNMDLDTWRELLWAQALGEDYNKLTELIYQEWLRLRYEYLALAPEIKHLLQSMRKHYFLGLITNGPSSSQWEKVERLNLRPYFDVILVSGDLPWEKPHHKIFHEACDYLGIEPHQSIMVGDKLETDVLGGIRAQLGGTVWIPLLKSYERRDNDPKPNYIIKHVTDLPNLLPQIKRVPIFRDKLRLRLNKVHLSDVEDCNSNSSDGS